MSGASALPGICLAAGKRHAALAGPIWYLLPMPGIRLSLSSALIFAATTCIPPYTSAQPLSRPGPGLSRAEKLEGKLRVAMLKANKDITGQWIKAAELKSILNDTNLILIDVRQLPELDISIIPGALSTAQFASRFRTGIPAGRRIVVYCTIGYRSGKYAEQLAAMGIKSENLEGGMLMWSFAGGPLIAKNEKDQWVATNRIHVYDAEWNIVHPDYLGVLPQ
jgi:rhodanese-related sulfurtransferase